jgi:hypothetical protein
MSLFELAEVVTGVGVGQARHAESQHQTAAGVSVFLLYLPTDDDAGR